MSNAHALFSTTSLRYKPGLFLSVPCKPGTGAKSFSQRSPRLCCCTIPPKETFLSIQDPLSKGASMNEAAARINCNKHGAPQLCATHRHEERRCPQAGNPQRAAHYTPCKKRRGLCLSNSKVPARPPPALGSRCGGPRGAIFLP